MVLARGGAEILSVGGVTDNEAAQGSLHAVAAAMAEATCNHELAVALSVSMASNSNDWRGMFEQLKIKYDEANQTLEWLQERVAERPTTDTATQVENHELAVAMTVSDDWRIKFEQLTIKYDEANQTLEWLQENVAEPRAATTDTSTQAVEQRSATVDISTQAPDQRVATAHTASQAGEQRSATAHTAVQACEQRVTTADTATQAVEQRSATMDVSTQVGEGSAQDRVEELERELAAVKDKLAAAEERLKKPCRCNRNRNPGREGLFQTGGSLKKKASARLRPPTPPRTRTPALQVRLPPVSPQPRQSLRRQHQSQPECHGIRNEKVPDRT